MFFAEKTLEMLFFMKKAIFCIIRKDSEARKPLKTARL